MGCGRVEDSGQKHESSQQVSRETRPSMSNRYRRLDYQGVDITSVTDNGGTDTEVGMDRGRGERDLHDREIVDRRSGQYTTSDVDLVRQY